MMTGLPVSKGNPSARAVAAITRSASSGTAAGPKSLKGTHHCHIKWNNGDAGVWVFLQFKHACKQGLAYAIPLRQKNGLDQSEAGHQDLCIPFIRGFERAIWALVVGVYCLPDTKAGTAYP